MAPSKDILCLRRRLRQHEQVRYSQLTLGEPAMERQYKPEDAAKYQSWKTLCALLEYGPGEVFKWLGWITAIAAVKLIDARVDSAWLHGLPLLLSWLVGVRVYWLLGLKDSETLMPDGSALVKLSPWKLAAGGLASMFAFFLAVGAANLITESNLLPPQAQPQVLAVVPSRSPAAKPSEIQKPK
jgi:hypothetical protein